MALGVGVGGDLAPEAQRDVGDVVERELLRGGPLERLEVDPAVDPVELGRDGAGAVLEREAVALVGGPVAEPGDAWP